MFTRAEKTRLSQDHAGHVSALEAEGLRAKTKVIIGGGPVSERYAESIGADAYAFDAIAGVKRVKKLVSS